MFESKLTDKYILILGLLIVAFWASPLWLVAGKSGIHDWHYSMERYEAVRRTLLEFKQWPGNNPWTLGGLPLLGNPSVGILSIKGLFVLLMGTFWGLRISLVAYLFIGFLGAWKLSSIWWESKFVRTIFCFYVTANPALIYHITLGHLLFQTFYFFPILLYFLLRFKEDRWSGLKSAIIAGIAINDCPAYSVQYGLLILGGIFIWLYISNRKKYRQSLLNWMLLFFPTLIALSFYRIVTVLQLAIDFPRYSIWKYHLEFKTLLEAYFVPHTGIFYFSSLGDCAGSWEVCCYVGIIAFVLIIWGWLRSFRWWHILIILLVWAGAGNNNYFYIMYWIQKIPGFSSHSCITRIRMFTLLFCGISASWGLSSLWDKYKHLRIRVSKAIIFFIGVLMAVEVLAVSHKIMNSSHIKLPFQYSYNPKNKFQNTRSLQYPYELPSQCFLVYEAMKLNLGWLGVYARDPWLSSDCIRLGRDEPTYIAEFHQNGLAVEPTFWSPNRIVFNNLKSNIPLVINMNPGKPWYCNSVQLFPQYKIVEQLKPFEVMPSKEGVVDLVYRYPGQKLGLTGTIIFLFISFLVICFKKKRYKNKMSIQTQLSPLSSESCHK
jgi:hypothetical protein